MILSTLVISQLHFDMCAGLYGHPVYEDQQNLAALLCAYIKILPMAALTCT